MLNRVLATVTFFVLHIVFFAIFKHFIGGNVGTILTYFCTIITFVFLDKLLLLKHKKRETIHEDDV